VPPSDIVVNAPRLNRAPRIVQAHKPVLVQAFVAEAAVNALGKCVLNRLARLNELERDTATICTLIERLATDFWSVVTDDGFRKPARVVASDSRTLMTRPPGSEVSTSIAGGSRVKSSTIVSAQNRRPSLSASLTKSMLRRSFAPVRDGSGTRGMATRLRFRRRTARPSSRYTRCTSFDSPRSLHAATGDRAGGTPSAAAPSPTSGVARGVRRAVAAALDTDRSSARSPCSGTLDARPKGRHTTR
jgi:hypothetical protein